MKKPGWLIGICVFLAYSSFGQLLDLKGEVKTNQAGPLVFPFKAPAGKIVVNLSLQSKPGTVKFEVQDSGGALLGSQSAGALTMSGWTLTITNAGECRLVVTPTGTAGTWQTRIDQMPPIRALYGQMVVGVLMVFVALGSVLGWYFKSRTPWRWFWAGAGIWTVGVILKFALAIPLNKVCCPNAGHATGTDLAAGAIYCGLMTGIFEIGITLAAALVWRRLAAEPARAIAVGLGAGAFEALVLGLAALAGSLVCLATGQSELMLKGMATVYSNTSATWLIGAAERVIAILGHTASRVLVLRAVAGRTWSGFWGGFAVLSGMDLVAGAALLSGMTNTASMWLVELAILPFAVVSVAILRWSARSWPAIASNPGAGSLPEAVPINEEVPATENPPRG